MRRTELRDQARVHPRTIPAGLSDAAIRPLRSLDDPERELGVAAGNLRGADIRSLADGSGDDFDRLVAELQPRSQETSEKILSRLAQRHPDWEAQSSFTRSQVAGFLQASLDIQIQAFSREELPSDAPAIDAEAARAVARAG